MAYSSMDTKLQYNQIGQDYLASQKRYHETKGLDGSFRFMLHHMSVVHQPRILDVGCAGGLGMVEFQKFDSATVYGIDTSQTMIAEARKVVTRPELLSVQDAESTNFEAGFFDIIVCRFSLHYLTNLNASYKELCRILKPKGMLLVTVSHPVKDLLQQEEQSYGNGEMLTYKVHDTQVPLVFPSHTLSGYISETFLELFDIRHLYESEKGATGLHIPDSFGWCALKR